MIKKIKLLIWKIKIKREIWRLKVAFSVIYRRAGWDDNNLTTEEQIRVKKLANAINKAEYILNNNLLKIKD